MFIPSFKHFVNNSPRHGRGVSRVSGTFQVILWKLQGDFGAFLKISDLFGGSQGFSGKIRRGAVGVQKDFRWFRVTSEAFQRIPGPFLVTVLGLSLSLYSHTTLKPIMSASNLPPETP